MSRGDQEISATGIPDQVAVAVEAEGFEEGGRFAFAVVEDEEESEGGLCLCFRWLVDRRCAV